MSRACILPATGDPCVELFWLHFFKARWSKEIDKLYYVLNSPVEPKIAELLIGEFAKAGAKVLYQPHIVQHGEAIALALNYVTEDYIMLVENDAIVFKPGVVDEAFKWVESGEYDIVGSDRGSAGINLINAGRKKFKLDEIQHAYRYPHFWPNFFFVNKEWLLETDRHFSAKTWLKGDYIKEIDWTVEPDSSDTDTTSADTFGWASIQMMAKNPKVKYVEQYHAYPHDEGLRNERKHLWDGKAGWMHYGSVSTGLMNDLVDAQGVPLQYREHAYPLTFSVFVDGKMPKIVASSGKIEYERRCAYWSLCSKMPEIKSLVPDEFKNEYSRAIERFVEANKLNWDHIHKFVEMYKPLLKIDRNKIK